MLNQWPALVWTTDYRSLVGSRALFLAVDRWNRCDMTVKPALQRSGG